jgi:hypothetical protein
VYRILLVLIFFLNSQIIRRSYPAGSKSDGFFRVSAHSLNNPLVSGFFGQAPGEALDLGVSSTSGCNLGTVPPPCTWAPFKLMATTIQPSVNAELGMEEPTGKSRNRCMKTWRLPNTSTRRRVGVTKRRDYSFHSCWRSNFHAKGGVCLSLVSYMIHSREAGISRKRTLSFGTRKLSYLRPRLLYKVIQRGSEPS